MKSNLFAFIVGVVVTVVSGNPILGPYEDTIQPFNLSPGNVNPDVHFAQVYSKNDDSGKPTIVSPQTFATHPLNIQTENNKDEKDLQREKRTPQHHGGGHYGGGHGGGHYGGGHGGGHYGGGHYGGHGHGNRHGQGHGHHYG